MENSETNSEETSNGRRDGMLLESLRQLIAARFVLLPHRSKSDLGAAARAQTFSRAVMKKHDLLSVTNAFGFLNFLLGHGPLSEELPGFSGSMIYKQPGQTLRQSFYKWFVETALSLTVNKLEQHFGIWLTQIDTAQAHSNLEHRSYLARQSNPAPQFYLARRSYLEHQSYPEDRSSLADWPCGRASWREVFLNQLAANRFTSSEIGAGSRMVERRLLEVYARDAGQSYTQVVHLLSRQPIQ